MLLTFWHTLFFVGNFMDSKHNDFMCPQTFNWTLHPPATCSSRSLYPEFGLYLNRAPNMTFTKFSLFAYFRTSFNAFRLLSTSVFRATAVLLSQFMLKNEFSIQHLLKNRQIKVLCTARWLQRNICLVYGFKTFFVFRVQSAEHISVRSVSSFSMQCTIFVRFKRFF